MSIFSMFKKIFSEFDPYGEGKTVEQRGDEESGVAEYKSSLMDSDLFLNVNWKSIISRVFSNDDIKNSIIKLRKDYQSVDSNNLKPLFDEISDVADSVINLMRVFYNTDSGLNSGGNYQEDFDYIVEKTPTFKSQVVSALFKVISAQVPETKKNIQFTLYADEFNKEFNFDINNLTTLCKFISQFLLEYRKNPIILTNLMGKLLFSQDLDKFISNCYTIETYVQGFRQTPYNDISDDEKQEFLKYVNAFLVNYNKNNLLTKLNLLIKEEKNYQLHHPKFNPGIIGFKGY